MEKELELDLYAEELSEQLDTAIILGCFGTAGTLGTGGGCFGSVGTYGCHDF